MTPGFLYVNKHKEGIKKLNQQNNRLNTTNLTDELCKIGKNEINCTVENIILNW